MQVPAIEATEHEVEKVISETGFDVDEAALAAATLDLIDTFRYRFPDMEHRVITRVVQEAASIIFSDSSGRSNSPTPSPTLHCLILVPRLVFPQDGQADNRPKRFEQCGKDPRAFVGQKEETGRLYKRMLWPAKVDN